MPKIIVSKLTKQAYQHGLKFLSEREPVFAKILNTLGPPPLRARKTGFPTLIHIILGQQVSLASARAAMMRLLAAAVPLVPQRFLELDDSELKRIGFSRQKTIYGRDLAQSILEGKLDLSALGKMDDASVRSELLKIKGIGVWTADIYLLMALRRPDIWPRGDLALAVAVQKIKRKQARPTQGELDALSLRWRPWRAVAARLLWHYYLSNRTDNPK